MAVFSEKQSFLRASFWRLLLVLSALPGILFAYFFWGFGVLGPPPPPQCPLSEELKFYGKMEFLKNVQVNTKFFRRYGAEIQNFCRLLEGHIF